MTLLKCPEIVWKPKYLLPHNSPIYDQLQNQFVLGPAMRTDLSNDNFNSSDLGSFYLWIKINLEIHNQQLNL